MCREIDEIAAIVGASVAADEPNYRHFLTFMTLREDLALAIEGYAYPAE